MTDLDLSALTDVILACELFFLAGLAFRADVQRGSPAFIWAIYLMLTGTATMLGAIDHGFFEPIDHPANPAMKFATRAAVALGTFAMLMATARQFMSVVWQRVFIAFGLLLLAVTIWILWNKDDLMILIIGNGVTMLVMLGLHLGTLRRGTGSAMMCLGVVLTLGASMIVVVGGNGVAGLGLYGTLHVALMPAAFVLFLGGLQLRRTVT